MGGMAPCCAAWHPQGGVMWAGGTPPTRNGTSLCGMAPDQAYLAGKRTIKWAAWHPQGVPLPTYGRSQVTTVGSGRAAASGDDEGSLCHVLGALPSRLTNLPMNAILQRRENKLWQLQSAKAPSCGNLQKP